MDQNCREKSKYKSKRTNGNGKKSNRPSVEAIKVTIEKKRECNAKALEIVTSFSEGEVSKTCLIEMLPFINQEHYQDIIEERAINKLCGYPICARQLEKIPTKQYHISTTHNKVFDITDRKNFCSNLCYKASKYLKEQILTSPLWLRENHSSAVYSLISLQSKGGIAGDEVDLGHSSIKPEPDDTRQSDQNNRLPSTLLETDIDNLETKEIINYTSKQASDTKYSNECLPLISGELNNDTMDHLSLPSEPLDQHCATENVSNSVIMPEKDNCLEKTDASEKPDNLPELRNNSAETNSPSLNTCHKEGRDKESTDEKKSSKCALVAENNVTTQKSISKTHKNSQKRTSGNRGVQNHISPIQNVVLKIEQILKEWFSIDSLCLLLGEEKVKEMLAEKNNYIKEYNNTSGSSVDVLFYERYLAICKKLNLLELEDTKVDSSFRAEARKPLPDYETLKEEAEKMDLKVQMFYKGDKVVRFEEPQEQPATEEPVLPLVDLHAQKALRRRIVIDKLRRVLQDLQKSLGLRGFNFSEPVRTLISTFTLSAHNITMKPAEWNLIAIVIIKLLSLKDQILEQALNTISTTKPLTLLLMSYSLDVGYLDRITIWLTDVETIIQKLA